MPSDEEVTTRAGSVRAMTGFTEQAFEALLVPFEQAFVAYMQDHTIEGQPRTVRRYRTYDTCPLPTIADKLLFMRELSLARMGSQSFISDGVTIFQPKKKPPWWRTHPTRESGQSCDLIYPNPY
jgi:hypothetical protein